MHMETDILLELRIELKYILKLRKIVQCMLSQHMSEMIVLFMNRTFIYDEFMQDTI